MEPLYVQLLGSGDAFGCGGRFQTCIYVRAEEVTFLIDCGATSLTALRRQGLDPSEIDTILISHLHGDHFGGLPYLLLDAQFHSKRARPLTLAGPPGLQDRVRRAQEVLYPRSSRIEYAFAQRFIHLPARVPTRVGPLEVTPYGVLHPSGAPSYALRVRYRDKVLAYSGDTTWTDALVEVARGADLFFCECYFFAPRTAHHMNYQTLLARRDALECKRIVLTHMHEDMLRRTGLEMERGEDGSTYLL